MIYARVFPRHIGPQKDRIVLGTRVPAILVEFVICQMYVHLERLTFFRYPSRDRAVRTAVDRDVLASLSP